MSGKKPPSCSRCGAPVIFARTANGKHMPLDKARDLSGTSRYAVMRDVDLVLRVRTLGPGDEPNRAEHRHMPHHATCTGQQGALDEEAAEEALLGDSATGPPPPVRDTG